MVVAIVHQHRVASVERECQAPVLVDPDRPVAGEIADPRVQAEAVWAVAVARARAGDDAGAAAARRQFFELAGGLASALDRAWLLCNAARRSAAAGDTANAKVAFDAALAESRDIGDAFARAQAITRVAATLGVLRARAE